MRRGVAPTTAEHGAQKKMQKYNVPPSGQPVTVSFQVKLRLPCSSSLPSLFRALCVWSRPASLCEACSERGQAEGSLVSIGASSQLMRALAQSLRQKAQCSCCAITVAKGPVFVRDHRGKRPSVRFSSVSGPVNDWNAALRIGAGHPNEHI